MYSLRTRLLVPWLLLLMACATVGFLLFKLYELSSTARVGRAEAVVARTCDLIRERYAIYARGWQGPFPPATDTRLRSDLDAAVALALMRFPEVEGGVWLLGTGPLAYAYPTYPGEEPKTDLPQAEEAHIRLVNERAAHDERHATQLYPAGTETLLIEACPLAGPTPGLTAWTMTRVHAAPDFRTLGLGLGVLAALVLGGAGWLSTLLANWSRRIRAIESGLERAGSADSIPALDHTGARELDRIVDALNDAGRRLAEQRRRSDELAGQVAAAERLAGLGRVAGGLAHEIRNPLAAMQLRAENALISADPNRLRWALGDIVDQIVRMNALVTDLLAMTQRREPDLADLDLAAVLEELRSRHEAEAAHQEVHIEVASQAGPARIDPAMVGRILDNLVLNALRHTPPGGRIRVAAGTMPDGRLRITVSDTGPGVAPALRETLFEPFRTGRADGVGLGLAIARELAAAHGGTLRMLRPGAEAEEQGAAFAFELPRSATLGPATEAG